MESTRTPRQSGRRTFPSRPRSRIYRKKQSIVKRVASTLRRRRSQLHFMYQNALIEMAESKLNLPHEGKPGLIYAVSEIPTGHSRQSLIEVFDDVVATMSATTTKSSSQRSWETYQTSHGARSGHSMDLLTGDYHSPEDFDHYLTWQPLKPLPVQPSSKADVESCEPAELTWSPRTPSIASNVSLIDLDASQSTDPPTPPDVQSSYIDELSFSGLSEALTSPPLLPSQSILSLDAALFPQPLDFNGSPYPVLGSPNQPTSILATPKRTLQKRAVHGNLKFDIQHPAHRVKLTSPAVKTPIPTQAGSLIPRKPVHETATRHQQWLTPYHSYRSATPSPRLPPILTPATDSLLDEMNSEIDRVMESFSPAAPSTEQEQPRQAPSPSRAQPTATASRNTRAPSSFPRPPTHPIQIPPRTKSRAAITTVVTAQRPSTPATHASSSFRSRLGTSTLNALLRAADAASPSPSPLTSPEFQLVEPYASEYSYSWHRWVDHAGDPDSETEEREYSRRWRERRRGERRERGRVRSRERGGNDVD